MRFERIEDGNYTAHHHWDGSWTVLKAVGATLNYVIFEIQGGAFDGTHVALHKDDEASLTFCETLPVTPKRSLLEFRVPSMQRAIAQATANQRGQ